MFAIRYLVMQPVSQQTTRWQPSGITWWAVQRKYRCGTKTALTCVSVCDLNLAANVERQPGGRAFSATFILLHNINPLNAELNPFCHLLALLGVHHFLHVSRIRVKSLTLRLLMSYVCIYIYIYIYIYGAPILDVSRSHTTTQHSR